MKALKMSMEKGNNLGVDIFQLLEAASERKKRMEKRQILEPLNVKEFFEGGSIIINKRTCRGVECKLCIEACPTHALYRTSEDVEIEKSLCVYCAACVLICMVDDCIRIRRKRQSGEIEEFSNPRHVLCLLWRIDSRKRIERAFERYSS